MGFYDDANGGEDQNEDTPRIHFGDQYLLKLLELREVEGEEGGDRLFVEVEVMEPGTMRPGINPERFKGRECGDLVFDDLAHPSQVGERVQFAFRTDGGKVIRQLHAKDMAAMMRALGVERGREGKVCKAHVDGEDTHLYGSLFRASFFPATPAKKNDTGEYFFVKKKFYEYEKGQAVADAPAEKKAEAPKAPAASAAPEAPKADPRAAAEADGWAVHPDSPPHMYKGNDVLLIADVLAKYS